jgi:hypothetical protein
LDTDVSRQSNTAQISQINDVDGEYRLIGRVGNSTGTVLASFGADPNSAVSVFAGGPQEIEYMDGLRLSILSTSNMLVNVNLASPLDTTLLPSGTKSLCKYYNIRLLRVANDY